jgi:hypothetical protein
LTHPELNENLVSSFYDSDEKEEDFFEDACDEILGTLEIEEINNDTGGKASYSSSKSEASNKI